MRHRLTMIALAVVVAACGSSGGDQGAAPDASTPAQAGAGSAAAVPDGGSSSGPDGTAAPDAGASPAATAAAPLAVLSAVGGGQIDAAALVGRDLALWFWAPW